MRVMIVSCVFPPEPVVSAQTSAHLARRLVELGHTVTVITGFPNRPGGEVYSGYRRRLCQRSTEQGLKIVRCFATISKQSRFLSRLLENVSFGITSSVAVLLLPRPDLIYANTWPLFAGALVMATARLRRIPVVLSIQDVYPESLISQRRLGAHSRLARMLRAFDGWVARGATALVPISTAFAKLYQTTRSVPAERIIVVPNWVDSQTIQPNDPAAAAVRAELGIPADVRLAAYCGNIGFAAGVESVIDAFQATGAMTSTHLLIAGAGSQLAACRKRAEPARAHISFLTPWPVEDTSRVLSAADYLILPTRGEQSLASIPSKLIGYMLAGRPVVAAALPNSDLAETVESAGCGWVVLADQPQALADQLKALVSLPADELIRRGQAGREYALRHFVGETCLPKLIGALERVAVDG
jgi:putative colanic acid biosynthesis glycosyltransferase WcaI